ncbi:hypothetical protein [Cesiribacter andamanensis]|uniref:Lipocalin-like domain-containing protein n=1 Tax=Cesiribacter andamanensis AMV16 TaxID=1279009 RepID=M7N034_9BACT|nr:hypothetical protein [Cesiribacter andamanensis]EMR00657.1 hypothetical protein ADICEAN_04223 [Cesiribacter andamanensis AMV16]
MKSINRFFTYSLLLSALVAFTGCGDDDDPAPDNTITLAVTGTDLETTGAGMYRYAVESGEEVALTVTAQAPAGLSNLVITKTINNQVDQSYGTNGSTTVNATGNSLTHNFTYTPDAEDVDQLVGFTFEATNANGVSEEVVLTLVVTLSPIDNLPRRQWNLTSVYWVDEEEEGIKECEKDNYWLLNEDGTMEVGYGEDTATGDCAFDGFNVWETWEITEEDGVQYFTRRGYGIFDPETPLEETFTINELTTTTMKLQQTVDLSELGGDAEETFIYTYEAGPGRPAPGRPAPGRPDPGRPAPGNR